MLKIALGFSLLFTLGCEPNTLVEPVGCPPMIDGFYYRMTFNGHYYYTAHDPSFIWHHARSMAAKTKIGHLLTITSKEENEMVMKMIKDAGFYFSPDIWLNLNDEDQEGIYVWGTHEPFGYSNWEVGEPNDQTPGLCDPDFGECESDYARIRGVYSPNAGEWYDIRARYDEALVVIEVPVSGNQRNCN